MPVRPTLTFAPRRPTEKLGPDRDQFRFTSGAIFV